MKWLFPDPPLPYADAIRDIDESRFVEIDGLRAHVKREGEGSPILLLHGLGSSAYAFRKLAKRLSERFELVAVDLHGFGYTQRPRSREAYTLVGQARALTKILDALGVEKSAVLGHSYGGAVASVLATEFPERVSEAILVAPILEIAEAPEYLRTRKRIKGGYWFLKRIASDPETFRNLTKSAFYREGSYPMETSEEYRRSMYLEGFRDTVEGFGYAFQWHIPDELKRCHIEHPTLVVRGDEDSILREEDFRKLVDSIPNAKFETIQDCGHSPPEEAPDELAEIIRRFLSR